MDFVTVLIIFFYKKILIKVFLFPYQSPVETPSSFDVLGRIELPR